MDMVGNIITFIIVAGIIQGVFQAFVLFGIRKGNRRSNYILAFLLLAFSINIAHSAFDAVFFSQNSTHFIRINEPFQLLLGPIIYFYVRELTRSGFNFRKKDFLHFIPFILYTSFVANNMVGLINISTSIKNNAETITIIVWVAILLHISTYVLLSTHHVKLHEKKIKESYSEIEKINLKWLKFFIILLQIIYFVYFILLVLLIHKTDRNNLFPHFQNIICLALSAAVYSLGYRGLTQPEIFTSATIKESPAAVNESENTSIKYVRSSLDSTESDEIAKKLLDFINDEKPYLNPELTLNDLSSMLEIPRNRLSQVLNENLGMNFYDFINGYRLKEVQKLMCDPKNDHIKLLALAFDAGFNSKAAFNRIFKKSLGITPSDYKKNNPQL